MKHLLILLATFLFAGCGDNPEDLGVTRDPAGPPVYDTPIEVSKMQISAEGRKYLEVDGKPFLMLGSQLRTDYFLQLDKRALSDLGEYFELAKKMNITVIQVPIGWRDVEPERDQYTDEMVGWIIEYCNRYDLKLEILWYGSYMCGYSVRGYIPNYVVNDSKNYPDLNPNASFIGWLGKQYYLKPNTPLLVDRESKALAYMMDAIWEYDRTHGGKRTVVGIQIENEADMLATRHNNEHGFQPADLWDDLIDMMDTLGKVVKNSKYKCYTRTNFTTTYNDYITKAAQLISKGGVDFVGLDPYINNVSTLNSMLDQLGNINGNFGHIAENGGEYTNNDILTLNALVRGMGYEIFEVITTPNPRLTEWTLRGLWNPDFTEKSHTQRIVNAYKIFKNAWYDFAIAKVGNMVGFNINENELKQTGSEEARTQNVKIKWQTTESGIAYAIENNKYLIVSSTKQDKMQFEPLTKVAVDNEAEEGYYDTKGEWVTQSVKTIQNNSLTLEPTKTYRIALQSAPVEVSPTSITTTGSAKVLTISVNSKAAWTASVNTESASWCNLGNASGSGGSTENMAVNLHAMTSGTVRTATIKVESGGIYEEVVIKQGVGVEIAGLIWAYCNVGQPNTFTENIDLRGLLYQYNSKIGYPNSSPNTSEAPAGYSPTGWFESAPIWTAENNPCPAGWRIPNNTEIQTLLNKGYAWVEPTVQNGLACPGAVIGVPSSEISLVTKNDMRGGIFWPQTGYRENTQGKQNNWWEACITSITRPGQNWDRYTYLIDYTSTLFVNEYTSNASAFPVRCVRDVN